jgi:hypothetical protein
VHECLSQLTNHREGRRLICQVHQVCCCFRLCFRGRSVGFLHRREPPRRIVYFRSRLEALWSYARILQSKCEQSPISHRHELLEKRLAVAASIVKHTSLKMPRLTTRNVPRLPTSLNILVGVIQPTLLISDPRDCFISPRVHLQEHQSST